MSTKGSNFLLIRSIHLERTILVKTRTKKQEFLCVKVVYSFSFAAAYFCVVIICFRVPSLFSHGSDLMYPPPLMNGDFVPFPWSNTSLFLKDCQSDALGHVGLFSVSFLGFCVLFKTEQFLNFFSIFNN